MASTLLPPHPHHYLFTQTRPKTRIYCERSGPRSNRGPLQKGRILSTEAILAIQSLKRSHKTPNPSTTTLHVSPLTRLFKTDLIATFLELLRQDECALALLVLSTITSEPWYTTLNFSLYADIVLALSRNSMWSHIDRLIHQIDDRVDILVTFEDKKGLARFIRALIAADRRAALVKVYNVIKRAGWGVVGSGVEVDEYLGRVLVKGFVRFGEVELAKEVESILETYLNSCLGLS